MARITRIFCWGLVIGNLVSWGSRYICHTHGRLTWGRGGSAHGNQWHTDPVDTAEPWLVHRVPRLVQRVPWLVQREPRLVQREPRPVQRVLQPVQLVPRLVQLVPKLAVSPSNTADVTPHKVIDKAVMRAEIDAGGRIIATMHATVRRYTDAYIPPTLGYPRGKASPMTPSGEK